MPETVGHFFTASPSAPLWRLCDIFLVAQPHLLWEEGSAPSLVLLYPSLC